MSGALRPVWVQGLFNATKCARYLRGIGVELLPQQVSGWLTQERLHRRERRITRRCEGFRCQYHHRWRVEFRRRSKKQVRCPECGSPAVEMWLLWYERGDERIEVNVTSPLSGERWDDIGGGGDPIGIL